MSRSGRKPDCNRKKILFIALESEKSSRQSRSYWSLELLYPGLSRAVEVQVSTA